MDINGKHGSRYAPKVDMSLKDMVLCDANT